MSEPTLKETEEFLIRLWTKRAFLKDTTPDTTTPGLDCQTLDERGMSIYANLLRLNHIQVMEEIFPRTAGLAGKHWENLALAYLNWRLAVPSKDRHGQKNFLLNHIGDAFYDFLIADFTLPEKSLLREKHPYLADLSQYEIVQKELLDYTTPNQEPATSLQLDPKVFSTHGPIINPHLRIFHANWDVSALLKLIDSIAPSGEEIETLKIKPSKMILLAIQNPNTGNIKLIELNELTALMIRSIETKHNSYEELFSIAADHLLMPKKKLMDCCLQLFLDLKDQGIIIGERELLRGNKEQTTR